MTDLEDQFDIAYHMPFLEEQASNAAVIVEIGVGLGNGSTRAFGRGLSRSEKLKRMHIGVDNDADRPYEKPSHGVWFEVHGDSRDLATRYRVQELLMGRPVDILFIDTDHTYDQMQKELEVWSPIAGPSTLWIFHDTHMMGEYNHMTDAIKEFTQANGWTFIDHSREAHGLGLMRA